MENMLNLYEIDAKELIPGFHGKMVHGSDCTIAFWEIEQGAELPEHHHVHEQISHLLEGQFEFTLNGNVYVFSKGDIVVIPSNAVHSGKALSPCKIMDVFTPKREDYA